MILTQNIGLEEPKYLQKQTNMSWCNFWTGQSFWKL